ASAEQERLQAEAERLDRHRIELDTQTTRLSERSAQLEAQQGVIAVLRTKLDRTREEVEREAEALTAARVREEEAQAELHRRARGRSTMRVVNWPPIGRQSIECSDRRRPPGSPRNSTALLSTPISRCGLRRSNDSRLSPRSVKRHWPGKSYVLKKSARRLQQN